MIRDLAVTRIQEGLGFAFRSADRIVLRMQEAQRELEMGKTLPKFLLRLEVLAVTAGTNSVALPTGFLRLDNSIQPYYFDADGEINYIKVVRDLHDAQTYYLGTGETSAPLVMTILNGVVYFINTFDANYSIIWSYYKAADPLTTNIENSWLANAPECIIGEAGWRMAMDLRDAAAVGLFDTMRKTARLALFSETVADEETDGPLVMGANL